MTPRFDVVVVYSGGLDSTTMLFDQLHQGRKVAAISVDYGQRHARELLAASKICAELRSQGQPIMHEIVDLRSVSRFLGNNALVDASIAVPEGHYEDETMRATVVPNRNMILLSLGLAWAINLDAPLLAYAAHRGDHAIYPDCRPEFVSAMQQVATVCDYQPRKLSVPYLNLSKAEIVRLGETLGVPWAKTWSCYVGGEIHCGRCGTCSERREAFTLAGVPDPTEYLSKYLPLDSCSTAAK